MTLPGIDQLTEDLQAAIAANDPTAYLFAEHMWTRGVLEELRTKLEKSGISSAEVDELARFIDLHIRREEEAYFPALEPIVVKMRLSTFEMYGEHDAIRIRIEEFQDAIARGRDLTSALAALRRALVVHFDNEEELFFYEPAEQLTQEARRQVLAQFEKL